MARVRAFAATLSQDVARDYARTAIVVGCALSLILAGAPLPL